jgi:Tol biopolymer transport system component
MLTAAVAAVLHASAGVAPASPSALPSDQLLFVRGPDLYVAASDGTRIRRLARNAREPAVSPDARRIAFMRRDGNWKSSLWVMNRNGSQRSRLTTGHRDFSPAWSPDGRFLYFTRIIEGKDEYGGYEFAAPIFRMRADGTEVEQITHPTASDHGECDDSPAPAPDGTIIAYATIGECDRGNEPSLWAVDLIGIDVPLTGFDIRNGGFDPSWSPDGARLAFAAVGEWGSSVGIEVATGGERRARRVYKRPASRPSWSSSGEWLALVRGVGRGQIWLVRHDGSDLRRFSRRPNDADPAWLRPVG